MSTTFTDEHDHEFRVTARNINSKDCVSLGMPLGGDDGAVWREFPVDDAPAIALAILEAADCGKAGKIRLSRAMIALVEHISAEKERAEREAEDPKVREFRESSMSAIATVFNESNADSKGWDGLSEAGREGWRARYRAAREFFQEA